MKNLGARVCFGFTVLLLTCTLSSCGGGNNGNSGDGGGNQGNSSPATYTVAGTGVSGYSGDGGPALSADLNSPYGVSVDTSGNVYIADTGNCVIRKVDSSGKIMTIAGNGNHGYDGDGMPATSAALQSPYRVVADGTGNFYIADFFNNRIRKVDTSGTITTVAGTGIQGYNGDGIPATTAQLSNPAAVAVDTSGNIYIADICELLNYTRSTSNIYKPMSPATGPLPGEQGSAIHEDLGKRFIAGVETEGTHDTLLDNPGVFGNDREMTVENEFWWSPQLGLNLLSIKTDPHLGKQTFTVTDLVQGDPDPSLFQLPAGFEIVDRRQTGLPQ